MHPLARIGVGHQRGLESEVRSWDLSSITLAYSGTSDCETVLSIRFGNFDFRQAERAGPF